MDERAIQKLIALARAGDVSAWNRLQEGCQPQLLNRAQRLLGKNWQMMSPRDLTQETWLRAWRGIDNYRGQAFLRWLGAIMRNVYLNVRRGKRYRHLHFPLPHDARPGVGDAPGERAAAAEPAADESSAGQALLDEERAVLIQRALASMDEELRTIVQLSIADRKLSFKEIGERLGLTEKQALTRYHRGIAILERELKGLRE